MKSIRGPRSMSEGERRELGHQLQLHEYVQHIPRVMQEESERQDALSSA